jgi:hypothetical protein
MRRLDCCGFLGVVLCSCLFIVLPCGSAMAQNSNDVRPDSYAWNNRPADPRFKADILVVVAHPDDETMVTAYLAREIYDQHKRVARNYRQVGLHPNSIFQLRFDSQTGNLCTRVQTGLPRKTW